MSASRFQPESAYLFDVVGQLRTREWSEEQRVQCPMNADGGTDGVAVVVDADNKIRALTVLGGTGDHYHQIRLIFDEEERPRVLLFGWADVEGGVSNQRVTFDAAGDVRVCEDQATASGLPRPALCANENPTNQLNPEVRAVLRAGSTALINRDRDALKALAPRVELSRCAMTLAR